MVWVRRWYWSAPRGAHAEQNIVQTAMANKNFKTLVSAIEAADLATTLEGKGPFTVFAPTDAAFQKLGKDTLSNLLKPQNKAELAKILKYHVVAGRLTSKEVANMHEAKTVEGTALVITVYEGKVMVGKAHVEKTDIQCTNGVIHVIDTVLMPKAASQRPS